MVTGAGATRNERVMTPSLMAVAEELAVEFPDEEATTVIQVLIDCAAEFPDSDLMFVGQAARARLSHGG